MRIRREQRGQTLVEFSVILPVVLLTLVGVLQFMFFVCTKIQLQNTAARLAYQRSVHTSAAETTVALAQMGHNQPWGYFDPLTPRSDSSPLAGWRRYPGIATLDTPACLSAVNLTYRFQPRFLFRWIHAANAYCELPVESIPPEDS